MLAQYMCLTYVENERLHRVCVVHHVSCEIMQISAQDCILLVHALDRIMHLSA